jgi:hypothetical protein
MIFEYQTGVIPNFISMVKNENKVDFLENHVEIYHALGVMKHIETQGIHTKDLVFSCVSTCFKVFPYVSPIRA